MKKTVLASFTILCLLSTVFLTGLSFNIQSVKSDWTWTETIYIKADGSVIPDTAPISSADNITYILTDNIIGDVPEDSSAIVVMRDNLLVDGAGFTVQGVGARHSEGIYLYSVSNVTIRNASIKRFYDGVYLYHSSNSNLLKNNITLYGTGWRQSAIRLRASSGNEISRNCLAAQGVTGVLLEDADNNVISGNNMSGNGLGIKLTNRASSNIISGNNIAHNDFGVGLYYDSSSNIVSGNNISNNDYGIYGGYFVINNTFVGNNITYNGCGIWLYEFSNNRFYHNNFMGNSQHVDVQTPDFANFWHSGYPSGGNYWSDYTGTDSDKDGIGESWYEINENNIDHYPLMGMFSDFNATSEYHVQTICNSTISNFRFNGTALGFNVTGEDGTVGFCRTCIPTALLNDTYRVFVNGTEVSYTLLPCSNSTHGYLYFTYNHSTQEVIILPEFPLLLILPLFMISTLLAVIVCRRKHSI